MTEMPPAGTRDPDRPSSRIRRILLVMGIAFALGFFLAALWMWAGSSPRSVVTVPNLHDLAVDEAEEALEDARLVLEVGDSLPNAEVAANRVLMQSPLPGREVMPGTVVQVILSSGPARHPVPPVVGLSREQAEQLLRATGLVPEVAEVQDLSRAGRVLGTAPEAGTVLAIPAPVQLRVSTGPPLVAVPDLLGLNELDVYGVLDAAELRVGELVRELRLVEPEGQVLAQDPFPGDSIPAGSDVDVVVATRRVELLPSQDFR